MSSGGTAHEAMAPAVAFDGPRVSSGTARAVREAWHALWTSRLVVWAAGMLGVLWIGFVPNPGQWDPLGLTTPFSRFGDLLVAPAARWDSVWYLLIARDGYGHDPNQLRVAFYPVYPLLIHIGSWVLGSGVLVGILISLASFFGALVLLHRLTELELGLADARGTLMLMAFFPTAFIFSTIYTESLFLLLSLGAFVAARRGSWAWAGILAAVAGATRNSGVVLLLPLLILFLYGPRSDRAPLPASGSRWRPRYPLTPQLLWLALVPLGLLAFVAYDAHQFHDGLTPFHVERLWYRHFALLGGIGGGVRTAAHALSQIVHSTGPAYAPDSGNVGIHFAGLSIVELGFLVFALVGLVGVLRRLPLAYGAYVGAALAVSLSYPSTIDPLESFPRYVVVLFPLYMWLAAWIRERGQLERAIGVSAVLLGLFAAEWARWALVA